MTGVLLFSLLACTTLHLLSRALRRYLLKKETILLDLPFLGQAREEATKIKGTVVVCGGSISGLLAARVCHDHFERVVIVEPEAWLSTEDGRICESWNQRNKRTRVMQYNSTHGNLVPITDGLTRLFPNFEAECQKSGISIVPGDFRLSPGGHTVLCPHHEYSTGSVPSTILAGRRATETLIRRLTLDQQTYPNIQQISGTVTGVKRTTTNSDDGTDRYLDKVTIRTESGDSRSITEIISVLVVDCTGPTRAGEKWLRHAGFLANGSNNIENSSLKSSKLKTATYDPQMHYMTFGLSIPPSIAATIPEYVEKKDAPGIFAYKGDASKTNTVCVAAKGEGDFLTITCGAWGSNASLPDKFEGVKAHLESVKSATPIPEWIWNFLDLCQQPEVQSTLQVTKVRTPPSFWTHFESAGDVLPSNWIAIGDSVCVVNPIYGQGGTKAMIGAVSLNSTLHQLYKKSRTEQEKQTFLPQDFSQRFFRTQANKIASIWMGNKMIDYAFKSTIPEEGETLDTGSFIRWYLNRLERLCDSDKQIGSLFWHSLNAYGVSIDVLHPVIFIKVIFHVIVTSKFWYGSR
ncbi:hypothetical protein K435DRAFT_778036 [Dendrothele bispora CBS 962.96]|uniref:FAD/NAD(P)-binding domain-containing protein n=1 Tax=Dendrothele bispora (strain CBS 962.96) TaxID=1314807 RepID=A0A4V4HG49_DENBC|nr:hypothetical protein K435DRAFT_778036 [Dendrothele bispora CBS 962.96]